MDSGGERGDDVKYGSGGGLAEDNKSGGNCPELFEYMLGTTVFSCTSAAMALGTNFWCFSRVFETHYGLEQATINGTIFIYDLEADYYDSIEKEIGDNTLIMCAIGKP